MEALGQPNVSLSLVAIIALVALVGFIVALLLLVRSRRRNRQLANENHAMTDMRSQVWQLVCRDNSRLATEVLRALMPPAQPVIDAAPSRAAIGAAPVNTLRDLPGEGSHADWAASLATDPSPGKDPFLQPGPASKLTDTDAKPDWPPTPAREPVMRQPTLPHDNGSHNGTPHMAAPPHMAQPLTPEPSTQDEPVVATAPVPAANVADPADTPVVKPASDPLTDETMRIDFGALQQRWNGQIGDRWDRWEQERQEVLARLDGPLGPGDDQPSDPPPGEPEEPELPPAALAGAELPVEPDPVASQPLQNGTPTPGSPLQSGDSQATDELPNRPDTSFIGAPNGTAPSAAHDAYVTLDHQWRGTGATRDAGLPLDDPSGSRGQNAVFPPDAATSRQDLPAATPGVPEVPLADASTTIIHRADVPPVSVQPGHH